MPRLVQPQECIITTKICWQCSCKTSWTKTPSPPNVIMTLIFPQGLWTSPLIVALFVTSSLNNGVMSHDAGVTASGENFHDLVKFEVWFQNMWMLWLWQPLLPEPQRMKLSSRWTCRNLWLYPFPLLKTTLFIVYQKSPDLSLFWPSCRQTCQSKDGYG